MSKKSEALKLRAEGMTYKVIGEQLSTPMSTVFYWCNKKRRHTPHFDVLPKAHRPKVRLKAEDMVLSSDLSDKEKIRILRALRGTK